MRFSSLTSKIRMSSSGNVNVLQWNRGMILLSASKKLTLGLLLNLRGANCGTQMANVKQAQQIIPFVTREISFVGVDVFDSKLRIQVCSIKQPVQEQLCEFWERPLIVGTPSCNDHFDHWFIVLKHMQ